MIVSPRRLCLAMAYFLGSGLGVALAEVQTDEAYRHTIEQHHQMFQPVPNIQVIGPSSFPKPTDRFAGNIQPYMKPYHGQHRATEDAVFAYAAEYDLDNYVTFVQSLHNTGFAGDIVLSVSELDVKKTDVWNYLKQVPNIVVYVPKLICYNFENEIVSSAKGGIRTCTCDHLYAQVDQQGTTTPLVDPRGQRVIATIRYEIYWIWAQHYNPHSWILLIDARDTYFQSNPFASLPRRTDPTAQSGLLYFFGENMEATRLGQSKSNRKWIAAAYGDHVAGHLANKPTICSGATMGEQVALEQYARAIAAESDDTGTALMGADQGFHNFLYYSMKLKNVERIHDIVVFDQGTGIVNNMGAMRTKPLSEWGNGKITRTSTNTAGRTEYEILNWDGTLSPVIHQFDRHKELSDYFFRRKTRAMKKELNLYHAMS